MEFDLRRTEPTRTNLIGFSGEVKVLEGRITLVGVVPSNYYCVLETLTFYMDVSFYISLCMCHEMMVIILKYQSR